MILTIESCQKKLSLNLSSLFDRIAPPPQKMHGLARIVSSWSYYHDMIIIFMPFVLLTNRYIFSPWIFDLFQPFPPSFEHSSYSCYQNIVNVYASMRDLQLGVMERGITLPDYAQGSGMVAYNGSLYYNVRSSRDIARYDIAEQRSKKSPLPPTTIVENRGAYLSGAYSDIDFAVDESGLWVIFTTSSTDGVISISKLDPDTLLPSDTWVTSVAKSRQGNCFVICQVLHCTNGFRTHTDLINYYFDTKTSIESFTYVPIDSKYWATFALSYNPYDQKLYGWDNGHLVVYQILFKG